MKNLLYLVMVFLIIVTSTIPVIASTEFSCVEFTEIPEIECKALVALYNSTNGSGWWYNTNWLVTNTPNDWYGVTVESGHVISINFSYNNLIGNIPPELGNLKNLTELALINNPLSGIIPPELGNLTQLTHLDLGQNQLSGSIPPELGNLIQLTFLSLYNNQLSGSIPPELGNLSHLIYLDLAYNQLSGNIPPELGNLTNLTELALMVNQLSGSIPSDLGNLINLGWFNLFNNRLSGSIPPELGNLTNLWYLDLSWNHLSGSIPPKLGNLTSITRLSLDNNLLSGSIPVELGNLTKLELLDLSSNELSSNIPPELEKLTKLTDLYLNNNQLTGSIPVELSNLVSLTWLKLNDNQLSGSIPEEIGNLTSLQTLWLHDNLINGDIPTTFTQLVQLYPPSSYYGGLDLDYNMLNVPAGYPDPGNQLQIFLSYYDPDWQLYQGFTQVIGTGGGEFTSLDGRTEFLFPASALKSDTTFTFIPQPEPDHSPGLLGFAHNSFKLTAEDALGNPVTEFNLPITVTISYTDTEYIGPEVSLGLYYWDGGINVWSDVATTCPGGEYSRDPVANWFSLPLCHMTEFGVFSIPLNTFLPVVHR